MNAYLKTHTPPLVAACCLLLLLTAALMVRAQRDNGTYALETLSGDAAALQGARMDMIVADQVHAQRLTLEDGRLAHAYERGYAPAAVRTENIPGTAFIPLPGGEAIMEDPEWPYTGHPPESYDTLTYRASSAAVRLELKRMKVYTDGTARAVHEYGSVLTGLTAAATDYGKVEFYSYWARKKGGADYQYTGGGYSASGHLLASADDLGNGDYACYTEDAEGCGYVTPPLTSGMRGESAIYRVEALQAEAEYLAQEAQLRSPQPENELLFQRGRDFGLIQLCAFSVDRDMEALRLHCAGNAIYLLLRVEDALVLRAYSLSGVPLGEETLAALTPGERYHALCRNAGGDAAIFELRQAWGSAAPHTLQHGNGEALEGYLLAADTAGGSLRVRAFFPWDYTRSTPFAAGIAGDTLLLLETVSPDTFYTPYSRADVHITARSMEGGERYRGRLHTDALEDTLQFYEPFTSYVSGSGGESHWAYAYSWYNTDVRRLSVKRIGAAGDDTRILLGR